MSSFDSLLITCPKCGRKIVFQSKAGECRLAEYTLWNCPPDVGGSLIGDTKSCECGQAVKLHGTLQLAVEPLP